jgi:DNA ligase (NAD+)
LKFLDKASEAYYNGTPIISDEEFDALAIQVNYSKVGYQVTDGVAHKIPMYSLKKYFNIKDAPINLSDYVITPKLDGAAVSLLYVGGELALALTRGNGKMGRDITSKMQLLVPTRISLKGIVQVTGELVCLSSVENSRNVAAGSLNLKSEAAFMERMKNLAFVSYGVDTPAGCVTETYREDLSSLKSSGFYVINDFDYSLFPTDGTVYRLNSNSDFVDLGYTQQHPRGAFALKEQKEGIVTKLLNVDWQVGKSGAISPVAILEPIKIGDATVSRATLHNIEYIRELNLEIGCLVEVIRSGEIIPRIVRRIEK